MNLLAVYDNTVYNIIERKITDIHIQDVTSEGFTAFCRPPAGTAYVLMPTWTDYNGQDDIKWYEASMFPTCALTRIYYSAHNNEKGKYNVHIYAFDSEGNIIDARSTSGLTVR